MMEGKEDFRVIVTGCRYFYNNVVVANKCYYYLQNKLKTHNVIIMTGSEGWVDKLSVKFASDLGLQCELYPIDYERYGEEAMTIRNEQMVEMSDALILFWDERNEVFRDMRRRAIWHDLMLAEVKV